MGLCDQKKNFIQEKKKTKYINMAMLVHNKMYAVLTLYLEQNPEGMKRYKKKIKTSKDENRLGNASVKTAIRVELLTLKNNNCGIHKSLNKMLPFIF